MADVFVSYARTDKGLVAPLVAAIEARGWSVWWDPAIAPGQEFDDQISTELAAARAVLVVWTPASVTSRWVRGEAREAADRGVLVPVRFDAARLPIDARAIHTIDLDGWGEDPASAQCLNLLRALEAMIARRPGSGVATADPAGAQRAFADARTRVAICVLPFINMSGDPEQEYFSDGISEDIITDLSKVSALAVVARNTAFALKGKHVDVTQVARQLRVSHVLEGSVRKAGQRVRITAQLIDGTSGSHVWAERYDRDLNDIFALQDEISQAIVAALKLKLLPDEKKAIAQRGTSNPDAYRFVLMAQQQYLIPGDTRRLEAVVRLCQRAVDIDSNYARAWALMAAALRLRSYFSREVDSGLAAAERALALDANLAEAHAARAGALSALGDYDAALDEIEIAVRLDSESWDVNREAARLYYRLRRFEDAILYFEKAAALRESDWASCGMLISCYQQVGDAENARKSARRTLDYAERLVAIEPDGAIMAHAVGALAVLGETQRAKDWAERAVLLDPDNMSMRYNLACTMIADLGDAETGLDLLEPYFSKVGLEFLGWAKSDPDLDSVRDHPRFKAMLSEASERVAN
jgi:adenylate cyclase